MNKIYGYKQADVIGLAKFVRERKGLNLTETFCKFAQKTGKAKGTIRNMYYALVKHSLADKEFTAKYLGGTPLAVNKIVEFDEKTEQNLIEQILILKSQGKSVRGAILELANGDSTLALRYQNKYRNILKNQPDRINEMAKKLGIEQIKTTNIDKIPEVQYLRLKQEIDGLVERISLKIRTENEILKERISLLETENERLNKLVYSKFNSNSALGYLKNNKEKNVLN
ncbi:MAG: hypothetical protein E7362_02275 [Clostridiales bacterium]|nr:hypothetical protein [Clostridiales bacterium]